MSETNHANSFNSYVKAVVKFLQSKNTTRMSSTNPNSTRVYNRAKRKFTSSSFFKFFFILSIALALSEPILIGFGSTGIFLDIQIAVLAASTGLFFVGLYFTYSYITSGSFCEKIELIFSREVIGEVVCLAIGWSFIFVVPEVAALRCFRVFRLLWYLGQDPNTKSPDYHPEEHWVSIRQTCNLCVSYLQRLGEEIFSAKSRGGLVVIALFFYTTYIIAVIFHGLYSDLDTPEGKTCHELVTCFITMLRLAFYDVNGFNYFEAVVHHGNGALAALLLGYMIFSAFMLLNGLIGIFGQAFSINYTPVKQTADMNRHGKHVIHNAFHIRNNDIDTFALSTRYDSVKSENDKNGSLHDSIISRGDDNMSNSIDMGHFHSAKNISTTVPMHMNPLTIHPFVFTSTKHLSNTTTAAVMSSSQISPPSTIIIPHNVSSLSLPHIIDDSVPVSNNVTKPVSLLQTNTQETMTSSPSSMNENQHIHAQLQLLINMMQTQSTHIDTLSTRIEQLESTYTRK